MKKQFTFILLVAVVLSLAACSSSKKIDDASDWKEVGDPFQELTTMANDIIESGGVAAVGEGRSTRKDIAKQKAIASSELSLAGIFERKVEGLKKNFQEEVGQGQESEVNELFSVVSKTTISKALVGAIEKDYKILQNDDGEYMYGVVLAITPKTANMSILDEMSTKKPQLYQRFRASQAFEELEKEMAKQEKGN